MFRATLILAIAIALVPAAHSENDTDWYGPIAAPFAKKIGELMHRTIGQRPPNAPPSAGPVIDGMDVTGVGEFFQAIQRDVQAHDWKALLEKADPENRNMQMEEVKLSEGNYIAELLGLDIKRLSTKPTQHTYTADGKKQTGTTYPVSTEDLNRIQSMTYDIAQSCGSQSRCGTGTITLSDGTRLPFNVRVFRKTDGKLYIGGNVG